LTTSKKAVIFAFPGILDTFRPASQTMKLAVEQKIYYVLRVAVAMCFIGHGAFGVITKPIWVNYFNVFGIGHDTAYTLMPYLGLFDIALGILMLIYPIRIIPVWLVIWGAITALLRPLSGEPFAESIERAGNYGAPLAMLLLIGKTTARSLFFPIYPDAETNPENLKRATLCLRIVVFMLIAGHGWLNFIGKPGLVNQYTSLGFTNPATTAQAFGIFEMIAGLLVLIRPLGPLLFVLLVWKVFSEIWYPAYPAFEWIERGGSYASILALWMAVARSGYLVNAIPDNQGTPLPYNP
jgi:uncharacterized membrane protein YphA (DoxX/SURF4 family)